jgi:hypothetical protein
MQQRFAILDATSCLRSNRSASFGDDGQRAGVRMISVAAAQDAEADFESNKSSYSPWIRFQFARQGG